MDQFGRVAGRLAGNPLSIIALFLVLAHAIAGLTVRYTPALSPASQVMLVAFIIGFPILVLGVFAYLVIRHHWKLYAPGDFRDDVAFAMLSSNDQKIRFVGQAAEAEAEREGALPSSGDKDHPLPVRAAAEATATPTTTAEAHAPASLTVVNGTQANPNSEIEPDPLAVVNGQAVAMKASPLPESEVSSYIKRRYFLAEELAIRKLETLWGMPIQRQVVANGVAFDGVAKGTGETRFIDVTVSFTSGTSAVLDAARFLSSSLKGVQRALRFRLDSRTLPVVALVLADETQNVRSVRQKVARALREEFSHEPVEVHVFKLDDLSREFGVPV